MSVLADLARPATDADRRRLRLATAGLAGAGALLLVAVSILTLGPVAEDLGADDPWYSGLAPFLIQPGLRPGMIAGVLLITAPFLAFASQGLRVGTAARERRLAALSLAGATPAQLRMVAAGEGVRPAILGALLAVPAHLVVWVVFGLALPSGWRLVPAPGRHLVAWWCAMAGALIVMGAISAIRAARVARVTPLGLRRRARRPLGASDAVVPLAAVGLVVVAYGAAIAITPRWVAPDGVPVLYQWLAPIILIGTVVAAFGLGPWLVGLVARIAAGGGPVTMLAGKRLEADVRTPGRIASVLLACGLALGIAGPLSVGAGYEIVTGAVADAWTGQFRLVGALAPLVAAVLAIAVASGALVVGANEQVLDGRRGIAALVAHAASSDLVIAVVRRQVVLVAVPAVASGALVSATLYFGARPIGPVAMVGAALAGAAIGWVSAVLAARGVRANVLACVGPENLRAP